LQEAHDDLQVESGIIVPMMLLLLLLQVAGDRYASGLNYYNGKSAATAVEAPAGQPAAANNE